MKIFIYLALGFLTTCKGAFLSSSNDPALNSVDYSNDGGKEEIITIVEESDLNQNYQQDPSQNYLPPTDSTDEIIQTLNIVEELQPAITSYENTHTASSAANTHTEAHFKTVPSHKFEQHYSEPHPDYFMPVQEQQQEYLSPLSESQTASGYLTPLADQQTSHLPAHHHQPQEHFSPTASVILNQQQPSIISQNEYSAPIQSQQEYLPPNQPSQIQPVQIQSQQQYVAPAHQHTSAVHQSQAEYISPATVPFQPQQEYLAPIQSSQIQPAQIQPHQQYVAPAHQHSSAVHQPQQEYISKTTAPLQPQREYLAPIQPSQFQPAQIQPHQQYVAPAHQHSSAVHQPQQEYISPTTAPLQPQQEYLAPIQPSQIQPHQQYVAPVHQHSSAVHQPQQEYIPPATSQQSAHFLPAKPQQRIRTIRIIHGSAGPKSHAQTQPQFEGVRTLRIIKSFAPHHSNNQIKAMKSFQDQPTQVHQEIPKTSLVSSGTQKTKTLRIIHSLANPVAVSGHQSPNTKTIKIIRNGSSPSYNQNNFGGTRTIRIIKARSGAQTNSQYLSQDHGKKRKF